MSHKQKQIKLWICVHVNGNYWFMLPVDLNKSMDDILTAKNRKMETIGNKKRDFYWSFDDKYIITDDDSLEYFKEKKRNNDKLEYVEMYKI